MLRAVAELHLDRPPVHEVRLLLLVVEVTAGLVPGGHRDRVHAERRDAQLPPDLAKAVLIADTVHVRDGIPVAHDYVGDRDLLLDAVADHDSEITARLKRAGLVIYGKTNTPEMGISPSTEPRLWVFDLNSGDMLFKELVAHGRHTGDNLARHFSDQMNSRQSSLGLFRTADTYVGSNGYSLRLDGLEPGFNGRARERAIVMHGAPYVSAAFVKAQGRLGRSWGCPAVSEAVARDVIDTVKGGGLVFSYYPDKTWMKSSKYLSDCD